MGNYLQGYNKGYDEAAAKKKELLAAIASQAAELEALRADAERYRFLRDKAWGKDGALALLPANEMDEAVDAARSTAGAGRGAQAADDAGRSGRSLYSPRGNGQDGAI